jgi:hypothetical protein
MTTNEGTISREAAFWALLAILIVIGMYMSYLAGVYATVNSFTSQLNYDNCVINFLAQGHNQTYDLMVIAQFNSCIKVD